MTGGGGGSTRTAPGARPAHPGSDREARRWLGALALLLVVATARPVAAAPSGGGARLDPAHTWAVIAGVLSWSEPELPSFSPYHRRDVALDALLAARGVPDAQRTLLLDDAATADAVLAALRRVIAAAGPDDTLVFYFDGHGILHPPHQVIFATSDARAQVKSGLHLAELPALFRSFKGKRVLLFADCCHSGGMGAVATALARRGVQVASLTSAEESKVSTENWTFTQALLDCLGGSALCDADGDGQITLKEMMGEARDTMLHREMQRIGWSDRGVPEGLVVADTRHDDPALEPGQARRGEWVALDYRGKSWIGRVLGASGDELTVSLYDYADDVRVTVKTADVRPISEKRWPVGAKIDVAYQGKAYLGRVLKVDGWLCYVTYPGWSAANNEWVGPDRIVGAHVPGTPATLPLPGSAAGAAEGGAATTAQAPADPPPGKVLIEWHGAWYVGEVTGERDGQRCVHYDGWGPEWDECVPATRIRAPKGE